MYLKPIFEQLLDLETTGLLSTDFLYHLTHVPYKGNFQRRNLNLHKSFYFISTHKSFLHKILGIPRPLCDQFKCSLLVYQSAVVFSLENFPLYMHDMIMVYWFYVSTYRCCGWCTWCCKSLCDDSTCHMLYMWPPREGTCSKHPPIQWCLWKSSCRHKITKDVGEDHNVLGKVMQCSLLSTSDLDKLKSYVTGMDVNKCVVYGRVVLSGVLYTKWSLSPQWGHQWLRGSLKNSWSRYHTEICQLLSEWVHMWCKCFLWTLHHYLSSSLPPIWSC